MTTAIFATLPMGLRQIDVVIARHYRHFRSERDSIEQRDAFLVLVLEGEVRDVAGYDTVAPAEGRSLLDES